MIKTKLKVVLTIAILALAVLIIPGICYAEEGTNDGVVIVKTSTDRYLIYIKDYLDVDFKFALSTDGTETPSIFTNFAVDTVDAQNHIAFSETGTEEYLWVKVGDEIKISGRKIDLTDNITMAELEGIENISKTIEIEIGVSEPVETMMKDEATGDEYKKTVKVGTVKIITPISNGRYQLVKRLSNEKTNQFFALAELIEKNNFTDKYAVIKTAKEFTDLKAELRASLSDWKDVVDATVKQPEDAEDGEQYILWLKEDESTVNIAMEDVHFLTSVKEESIEKITEDVTTLLPKTYDDNTILFAFIAIVIAIVAVAIRISFLKKKEMSK